MSLWSKLFGKAQATQTQPRATSTAPAASQAAAAEPEITSVPPMSDCTQYVVILASRSGEAIDTSPDVLPALESFTGASVDLLMQKARFTLFRNNPEPVADAKQGKGVVALEALAMLGSTLSSEERSLLLDRFMTTAAVAPVRHVTDSRTGEEFALIVFFDDGFKATIKRENAAQGGDDQVQFSHERRKPVAGVTAVYRHYKAPTKAIAREFLKQRNVTADCFFVVVETPEGGIARDKTGIYEQ